MNNLFTIALSGIQADLARTERAAMNLANVQTLGYKRQVAAAEPFASQVAGAHSDLGARSTAPGTDSRPGTLKPTGQPLDLAIIGEGWFEISTAQGLAYTRQGNFRLDASGRIVTRQGHVLMGASGEIQLMGGAPVIDAAGRVFEGSGDHGGAVRAGDVPVAEIKVVRFDGVGTLQRLGEGLVVPAGDVTTAPPGTFQVQQAVLENSNVNPMQEMVEIMQAVRHLESMQKALLGYDEMLGTSIRKLGEM